MIIITKSLNIKERAKKEENKANSEVKNIVKPIVEYLIISKFGHLEIKFRLLPEQKRKNLVIKLNFLASNII